MDPSMDTRPVSLLGCYTSDNELDVRLVQLMHDRQDDEAEAQREEEARESLEAARRAADGGAGVPKRKRTRSNIMKLNEETGEYETMRPEDSIWYKLYVESEPRTPSVSDRTIRLLLFYLMMSINYYE